MRGWPRPARRKARRLFDAAATDTAPPRVRQHARTLGLLGRELLTLDLIEPDLVLLGEPLGVRNLLELRERVRLRRLRLGVVLVARERRLSEPLWGVPERRELFGRDALELGHRDAQRGSQGFLGVVLCLPPAPAGNEVCEAVDDSRHGPSLPACSGIGRRPLAPRRRPGCSPAGNGRFVWPIHRNRLAADRVVCARRVRVVGDVAVRCGLG
jgi:hypothetical protein